MFQAGQIVKGKVCGYFVVIGKKMIGPEEHYMLLAYNPELDQTAKGKIYLPEDALVAI